MTKTNVLFFPGFLMVVAAAFALPASAAERVPTEIACPRTGVSPEVQARVDAGEKPDAVKSWFKPGLVNPQGFCAVTVAADGKRLVRTYNEATSVGVVPVRFEYVGDGLLGFIGDKAMPFGKGVADLVCRRPPGATKGYRCTVSVDAQAALTFSETFGSEKDGYRVAIDTLKMFGGKIKIPSIYVHYFKDPLNPYVGYQVSPAVCMNDAGKNVAKEAAVVSGTRNGASITQKHNKLLADTYELTLSIPKFDAEGRIAEEIVANILSEEAVGVRIDRFCDDRLASNYLTNQPRILNHILQIIKPRMLAQ